MMIFAASKEATVQTGRDRETKRNKEGQLILKLNLQTRGRPTDGRDDSNTERERERKEAAGGVKQSGIKRKMMKVSICKSDGLCFCLSFAFSFSSSSCL